MNEAQQIERVNSNKKRWNGEADEKTRENLIFFQARGSAQQTRADLCFQL